MKSMFQKAVTVLTAFSMVAGMTAIAGKSIDSHAAEVTIDQATMEPNLYQLMQEADSDHNGILSDAEAARKTDAYLTKETADISNVVKYFPNITSVTINAGPNKAVTINSSKVTTVSVYGQNPVALKGVSPKVVYASVFNKQKSIDYTKLEGYSKVTKFYLDCDSNATKVKVPNASKLTDLKVSNAKLTSFDTSKLKSVQELTLDGNNLKSLNVKKNKKLTSLACYNNKLTSLNISSNKNLKDIGVGGNKLKKVDISKNKKMQKVAAYNNKIKTFKSKKSKKIVDINLSNNKLTSFDAAKYPNLKNLMIDNNKVKKLTLAKNKKLTSLSLGKTPLKTLTLPGTKFDYVSFGEHYNFLKKVKGFNPNAYIVLQAKKKKTTYDFAKLAPALKGYTFSTYDTAAKVTAKGKATLAAPKKYSFITITAQKGSSTVTINF